MRLQPAAKPPSLLNWKSKKKEESVAEPRRRTTHENADLRVGIFGRRPTLRESARGTRAGRAAVLLHRNTCARNRPIMNPP
ncbi:MAG: hypothetical protein KGQ52_07650 [Alphaproteobacteria bacterium]|nr:hypothetical protein [Alphaproteobacteria bacterium]